MIYSGPRRDQQIHETPMFPPLSQYIPADIWWFFIFKVQMSDKSLGYLTHFLRPNLQSHASFRGLPRSKRTIELYYVVE